MPLDATPGQAAGSEGAAAPITVTDERSATAALEGLLDIEGFASGEAVAGHDTESGASAPDGEAGETPPIADEEGHSEPEEGDEPPPPAIAPPNSWSAEEKALFGKLPPEAQAVIASRESERDRLINQRTQEIAAERKTFEAERTAIEAQRTHYHQSLQQLLAIAVPEAKQFEGIDWARLAAENPAQYVQLSAARDALRGRVQNVVTEMQRVQQEAQSEGQQRRQGFLAEQSQKLAERVPEFADPDKGKALAGELGSWLKGQGFTEAEIGQVADHRLVALAVQAMRAEKSADARKTAELKRSNPAPTVQRPGTAQGAETGAAKRIQEKMGQLRRSGSSRDAVSLLMEIL